MTKESFAQNESNMRLPISNEYDEMLQNHKSSVQIDRSKWMEDLLSKNKDIKEIIEQVNPVYRSIEFARLYLPQSRLIDQKLLLALISQHLKILGLTNTQQMLYNEWDGIEIPTMIKKSQLAEIFQSGLHNADKFWDIFQKLKEEKNPEEEKKYIKLMDAEISKIIGYLPTINDHPLSDEAPFDLNYIKFEVENDTNFITEASINQLIYFLTTNKLDGVIKLKNSYKFEDQARLREELCTVINSIIPQKDFWEKLVDRFKMIQKEISSISSASFMTLFVKWFQSANFEMDPFLYTEIKTFIFGHEYFKDHYNKFFGNFDKRPKIDINKAPKVILGNASKTLFTSRFSIFDLPTKEFARQLTFWCSEKILAIHDTELLDGSWEKPELKYRSPHVCKISQHGNEFSSFAVDSILSDIEKKEFGKIAYFIKLADDLYELNNYFDLFCLTEGCFHSAYGGYIINFIYFINEDYRSAEIGREAAKLKDDYDTMKKKYDPIFNIDNNQMSQRSCYQKLFENNVPYIPYIGIYLDDLFKSSENLKTFTDDSNKFINVKKIRRVYKGIEAIHNCRNRRHNLFEIKQVQSIIDGFKEIDRHVLDEKASRIEKWLPMKYADEYSYQ